MTWNILRKSDRTIPVPFSLTLHDNDKLLHCEQAVRVIPGKRAVMFGIWDHKPVVAKLFFEGSKAKTHRQRDVNGIDAMTAVNIPTPRLLFQGTDKSKRIHILIFERILDSCSLDLLWQEKTDIEELTLLLQAVTIEIATQHVLGIVQKDIHLKNFLVTSKTIFTLDGGSIEKFDGILPKKESLDHLALFFSQLGAGTEELQQILFDTYVKARSWIIRDVDIEQLQNAIKHYNTQRWERYQKKIMRECTAFERIEKFTSVTMYDRDYESEEFKQFLENPDAYFLKPNTQILKAGRSSTVAKIIVDNQALVVKRYNIKNIFHWLRRCLRATRAEKSWKLSHHLRLMGIPTAKPIAFIEKSFLGLNNKSYFVMKYVDGKQCGNYFSSYSSEDSRYEQVANRILKILMQLAQLKMTHGDLKMTNIIINHERPVLIDLDGMNAHSRSTFTRAYSKELQRFMKNWETMPSVKNLFQRLIDKTN